MDFDYSPRTQALVSQVQRFMDEHVYPNVGTRERQIEAFGVNRWQSVPMMESLKEKAKAEGLWNLFLPHSELGAGLTNLEYAPVSEVIGPVPWAPEVFNCQPPDSGNMEVLDRYGSPEQKERWLRPMLDGRIRSAFAMTEPDQACSDATNVSLDIRRDGRFYVLNGRKWFTTAAFDPLTRIWIVFGRTNPDAPRHAQHSMILVEPTERGVRIERPLTMYGYDDAPHGHAEVSFTDVRVSAENLILGEGRGFEIAQGRLGPGRIHHCMRLIGVADWALKLMCERLASRVAFGKALAEQSVWHERVANARIDIEMSRLLTLKAADMMDKVGNKAARAEIAMIKVAAPNVALRIIDEAIQAHGAKGVSADTGLAYAYAMTRALRIADGPDEVHRRTVALCEFERRGLGRGKTA